MRTTGSVSRQLGTLGVILAGLILSTLPAEALNLFGLVDTGELYRSTNSGVTWTPHATLAVRDAVGLAASANASDLVIVTRSGAVYRSANGGANWGAFGTITASDVIAFTILPNSNVLALTESGLVLQSTDNGNSFKGLATLTASNCVSLLRGPLGRLYVLTRTGEVYQSLDSGASWTPLSAIAVSNAVTLGRKAAEIFILTETGEIYRSLNYGVSWLPVGAIAASNMSAMVSSGGLILASARTGEVYQSAAGTTWSAIGAVNQLNVISLGSDEPLATGVEPEASPPRVVVRAPYPNPSSNGAGTFSIILDRAAQVRLELYDVHGRLVATRTEASLIGGPHSLQWAPRQLVAGRYFVRYVVDGASSGAATWSIVR